MGKETFIIYSSFYKPISFLSDKQLGRLFRAIFRYNLGEVVEVEDDIRMAFEFFKNQFDIDEGKYQAKIMRDIENGRKGGNPNFKKGQPNPYVKNGKGGITQDNPPLSPITQDKAINDNVYDNENDINPPYNPPLGGGADLEEFARKQKELEAKEAGLCAKEQELLKLEAALKAKKHSELPDTGFVSPEYAGTFTAWLEYKRERRESYKSGKSLKAAYSKLLQLSGNDPAKASAIVEQSMANNWAGLFELKIPSYGNSGTRTGVVLADNSTGKYDNDDEKWKR